MDINQTFERIIALYDSGGDPNKMMQTMYGQNPNLNQMATQYRNMTQGRNTTEVLLQLAKQNGLSDKNIEGLKRILNSKK